MQCNIKVSRLRCYVKDYGEKKLDLLKYRRNCFFKYKLPKGIFIIQETEGALIAPVTDLMSCHGFAHMNCHQIDWFSVISQPHRAAA